MVEKLLISITAIGGTFLLGIIGYKVLRILFQKQKITLTDQNVKFPLILLDVVDISPDTKKFIFKLPSPDHILGLPVGQHVALSANINGQRCVRYYTPITPSDVKGHVDFVIKIYRPNETFPNGGQMSQYLAKLKPSVSAVDFRGPLGKVVYLGNGLFQIRDDKSKERRLKVSKLSLVAGGTGITPMFQLIQTILNRPEDKTKISLLFANNTEDDILLRDELDKFAKEFGSQFKRWYTIAKAPDHWKFSAGRITKQMFEEHLFPPSSDCGGFICGPPGFVNQSSIPFFLEIGYNKDLIVDY